MFEENDPNKRYGKTDESINQYRRPKDHGHSPGRESLPC